MRWLSCSGLRSKTLGRRGSSNFLNKQNARYFRIKPEMCSSLVSALLEYLASVKCDSTFLKWIWGLIKSTCVFNKWGYFYYSFYFYLQAIFAVIVQKKKKKKNQTAPNQKPHTTHVSGSALQVMGSWTQQMWFQVEWSCLSVRGFSCQWCLQSLSPSDRGTALFLQYTWRSLGYHRTADPREGVFKCFSHK